MPLTDTVFNRLLEYVKPERQDVRELPKRLNKQIGVHQDMQIKPKSKIAELKMATTIKEWLSGLQNAARQRQTWLDRDLAATGLLPSANADRRYAQMVFGITVDGWKALFPHARGVTDARTDIEGIRLLTRI